MNKLLKSLISIVPGKSNRLFLHKKLFFFNYPLNTYLALIKRPFITKQTRNTTDKVIYTVLTGNYNDITTPLCFKQEWDYICFTNNEKLLKEKHKFWTIMPINTDVNLDNQKLSRLPKILAHKFLPNYKFSIYIDANIDIISDNLYNKAEKFINNGTKLAITKHFERDCLYEERDVCVEKGKDTEENTSRQIEIFEKEGFPHHYGLKENNIIFREHNNPQIIKVMEDWWYWVSNYSKRDQLSLMYVLWKNNFSNIPDIFEKPVRKCKRDIVLRAHNQ